MTSRRIGIYGTGRAAAGVVDEIRASGHSLTTAIAYLAEERGRDIGVLTGGSPVGVTTTTDLEGAIDSSEFDVLIYCGIGGEVLDRAIEGCVDHGVDMVHANFVHPRLVMPAVRYQQLNRRARESGSRIVGTGMLPGFWLDVLPALLTSALPSPVSIEGVSRADISSWGPNVLTEELGIGEPLREGPDVISDMLCQSATIVAEVLGLTSSEARVSGGQLAASRASSVRGIEVAEGDCIGFTRRASICAHDRTRVQIEWTGLPAGYNGYETSLTITATGGDGSQIKLDTSRPTDPYPGTAARLVHAARAVAGLPGGLHTTAALSL